MKVTEVIKSDLFYISSFLFLANKERSNHLSPNFCAALGNKQAVIPAEDCHEKEKGQESRPSITSFGEFLQNSHSFTGSRKNSESCIMTFGEFLQHSHSYTGLPKNSTCGIFPVPHLPLSDLFLLFVRHE